MKAPSRKIGEGKFIVSEGISPSCQYELATPDIETTMLENLASEDLPKELDPDQAESDPDET